MKQLSLYEEPPPPPAEGLTAEGFAAWLREFEAAEDRWQQREARPTEKSWPRLLN